jgi:ClpX C4-type zinc finger
MTVADEAGTDTAATDTPAADPAATDTTTTGPPATEVACSFCLKAAADVRKLVAGPGVFICDQCVELSRQVIAASSSEVTPDMAAAWEQQLSDEDLLALLPKVAKAQTQAEEQLTKWVRRARARGITWTRIGAALGMTRQSAWERFSGEE